MFDRIRQKVVIDEWMPWWVYLADNDTFRGHTNYFGLFEYLAYRKETDDLRDEGAIRGNQFYIFRSSRKHKYRNCLCPFLYGKVEPSDKAGIISVKVRLNPFMRMCVYFLVASGVILGGLFAFLGLNPGASAPMTVIELVLAFVLLGAFVVGFPALIIGLDKTFENDKQELCELMHRMFPQ